jgi:hypothetical protein
MYMGTFFFSNTGTVFCRIPAVFLEGTTYLPILIQIIIKHISIPQNYGKCVLQSIIKQILLPQNYGKRVFLFLFEFQYNNQYTFVIIFFRIPRIK